MTTSEIPQGPPVPKTMGSHSRSFSYEQMQQMGLSKAIDEYHRLLETGAQINTPRIAGKNHSGSSSYVSSILKATVIRPLPTIARPETVIACIGALWSIVSFLIYSTAPITIPFLVWLAFAPATPLQIPAWLTNTYPALKSTNLQPPADLSVRVAAIIVALVALRAAEAAVSARALRRQQASENAITPERLEACYSGRPMAGASASSVDASSQKWQLVIQEVVVLSKQYEDAPMPVCTRADALAWLERVAKEVGFTLPREAYHGAESAMKAVEQVRKMLVADLVAVVAGEDISDHNIATLAADGWRLYRTEAIQNPSLWTQNGGRGFPRRFWGVYTKLMILNLTQYKRLVYLDADTVAARNIDELFLCDAALCGVLRHSERFNSGVMVLQPSEETLKDMLHHMSTTPSYTGGDQGFLNEYFSEFANSPLFDPSTSSGKTLSQTLAGSKTNVSSTSNIWKDSKGRMLARLPTIYNADLGLYVANSNRWTLPREKIGVIHYTLATFKPWQWYSNWILSENGQYWQDLRRELPVYGQNDASDENFQTQPSGISAFQIFSFLGPWLLSILMIRRWCWKQGLDRCLKCWFQCCTKSAANSISTNTGSSQILNLGNSKFLSSRASHLGGDYQHRRSTCSPLTAASPIPFFGFTAVSALAGFVSLGCALYIAVCIIISVQIEPVFGWILAYEWVTCLTLALYGNYLWLCYTWGQRMQLLQSRDSPVAALSSVVATATAPLSPKHNYFSMFASKKEDGEVMFVCGRRPWGESLVAYGVLLGTLGMLPWWTDLVGVTSFIGKIIGTAAGAAISTAICMQCFINLAHLWFLCGSVEKVGPSTLLGSSVLPILSIDKD